MSDAYVVLDAGGEPVGMQRTDAIGEPRATLVAIHGAGCDHHVFDALLPLLDRFDRYALDLPGRGASTGVARTSPRELAEVVASAIRAIPARAPVIVLGHSFGGAVAIELALAHPDAARGLVLLSTGARLRVRDDILASYARAEATGVPESSMHGFSPSAPADLVERMRAHGARIAPRTAHADWRAANGFDRLREIAGIAIPTLVITGSDDPLTPQKYAEHLAREIPHAALSVIEGAGHMALLESPDPVASIVRDIGSNPGNDFSWGTVRAPEER